VTDPRPTQAEVEAKAAGKAAEMFGEGWKQHMLAVTKADHVRIHRAGKPLIGGRGHSAATSRTPVGANALPDSGGSR
jgi:hypothetical protein